MVRNELEGAESVNGGSNPNTTYLNYTNQISKVYMLKSKFVTNIISVAAADLYIEMLIFSPLLIL